MKTKIFKSFLIAGLGLAGLIVTAKIIKADYKFVHVDSLHHRGETLRFINSFIN